MQTIECTQATETHELHAQSSQTYIVFVAADSKTTTMQLECTVAEGCEVHCIVLLSNSTELNVTQNNYLGARATLHTHIATLGTGATNYTLQSQLNGEHAISNVNWLFYAKQSEQYTLSATNVFNNRNGGGEMLLKGVAEHTAKVNLYGMINISLHGQGTDTYLTEDVLMLDSTAKVNAIPGLEIKTNDVKASHSAVVSKVTAEDLFYFETRGINEALARTMFIEGFLESVLEPMPPEPKGQVVELIQQKLI